MKNLFSFIFIAAFLFPLVGHAAVAPATTTPVVTETTDLNSPLLQDKSLAGKQKAVQTALTDIYTRLTDLSNKTQLAINQLNANGILTPDAQSALIATNTSIAKAKIDITAFGAIAIPAKVSSTYTLDTLKISATTAENSLSDAKKHLIDSLTSLKATLPTLDTTATQ